MSKCRACLNKTNLDQEVRLTSVIFRNAWVANLWSGFASWVYGRSPASPRILALVRSHQVFFERVDTHFTELTDISELSLLDQFGTAELRRHLLASRYIATRLNLEVSPEAKRDSADADRVEAIVIAATRAPYGEIIAGYLCHLNNRSLTARTTRMYLSTASSFCASENVGAVPWSPGQLERYLEHNKGAKNNLSGFVTYCREVLQWEVTVPGTTTQVRGLTDPSRSVTKLERLLKKADEVGIDKVTKQTVASILSTSLGFSASTISAARVEDFAISPTRVLLTLAKEEIELPIELWPFAKRLAQLLLDRSTQSQAT
ncbi:hypothetical protein [Massilia scottii]|uniref:hypothetical protein n=1 Tax=Massilia scottii TaxID=3057166 RepID=UPI0027969512|nr:hypothetical protein [Massilia sp. CCM 9029]MDQ1835285.1 hypothetical protein [Massilia sp. CCM 9029]